jgi:antitoxin component of MazEF toxin-antitoxin module
VRLPKAVLDQAGLTGPITLTVTENGILLSPARAVRAGWAEAAKALAASGEGDAAWRAATFDDREWTW